MRHLRSVQFEMRNESAISKYPRERRGLSGAAPPALGGWTDDYLMNLVRERDHVAFTTIFRRHQAAALALAVRICGERSLAEDAVQEAFLSLWRSCSRYEGQRGSVRSWVLTIVHNRSIDVLRRGAHERGRVNDEAISERVESVESTELEAGRREQARELRCALDLLPAEQSCVIRLAYYGGYTQAEIAAMLNTPVGTVKGRMRLGLQKLRLQLVSGAVAA